MKALLVVVLLAITCSARSADSLDLYRKAVDHLKLRALTLSMSNDPDFISFTSKKKIKQITLQTFQDYLNQSTKEYAKTDSLIASMDSLKSDNVFNSRTSPTPQFLSHDIFSEGVFKKFADKRGKTIAAWLDSLSKEITNLLKTGNGPPPPKKPIDIETRQKALSDSVKNLQNQINNLPSAGPGWTGWIIGFIAFFALGFLFRNIPFINIMSKKKERYQQKEHNQPHAQMTRVESDISSLSTRIANMSVTLNNLITRVEALESSGKSVVPSKIASVTPTQEFAKQKTETNTVDATAPLEIFYLSTPNPNGSFNSSSTTKEFVEGASIYLFSRITPNTAKFEIAPYAEAMQLALQYIDLNIDPVCEVKNKYSSKAKSIKTLDKGTAQLKGDKWIVITKANISYEL